MSFNNLSVNLLHEAVVYIKNLGYRPVSILINSKSVDFLGKWIELYELPNSSPQILWNIPIFIDDKVNPGVLIFTCGKPGKYISMDNIEDNVFSFRPETPRTLKKPFGLSIWL